MGAASSHATALSRSLNRVLSITRFLLFIDRKTKFPNVPQPEEVPRYSISYCSTKENYERWLKDPKLPKSFRTVIENALKDAPPIDIKPLRMSSLSPYQYARPGKQEPRQYVWIRAKGTLDPNDVKSHFCAIAYLSDFYLLSTSLMPHGVTPYTDPQLQMIASIDHILVRLFVLCQWFHAPLRADEWLLYEMETPRSNNSKGFTLGRIYTRDGTLAVSVAQEGVIRVGNLIPSNDVFVGKL